MKETEKLTPEEISLSEYLRQLILSQGLIKENGILDVTAFLNHQINPRLMRELGRVIGMKFKAFAPTKVLTAESSGIAPALGTAMVMEIPCVFAKKIPPITLKETYRSSAASHTKGELTNYIVDTRVIRPGVGY